MYLLFAEPSANTTRKNNSVINAKRGYEKMNFIDIIKFKKKELCLSLINFCKTWTNISNEEICKDMKEELTKTKQLAEFYKQQAIQFNERAINNENEKQKAIRERDEAIQLRKEYEAIQNELLQKIANFRKTNPGIVHGEKPEWLDERGIAYHPTIRSASGAVVGISPTKMYVWNDDLVKVVEDNKLYNMPMKQKIYTIWDIVCRRLKYRWDTQGEDWQFPPATWYLKEGDCEDGTVLFVTLCMLAGVDSGKVFNCCGLVGDPVSGSGHSFPIVYLDDWNGEGWYIFETTLNESQQKSMRFKGSSYYGVWGVSNWEYCGTFKNGVNQV